MTTKVVLTTTMELGKDTPNYKRLERKSMGDGAAFGSLYVDPSGIPEGATRAIVTIRYE